MSSTDTNTSRITMLGTGNAMCVNCYNTCFYLHTPRGGMLVDGGGGNGILRQLIAARIPFESIRNMFVTHSHTDHILGAIWMMRKISPMIFKGKHKGPFTIYCNDEVRHALDDSNGFTYWFFVPDDYKYDETKTEEENKAIKQHRARRKAVHTRAEKNLIGEWEPVRMANGETKPQVMARSRHILLMHKSKWNDQQKARAAVLFQMFPDLEKAYTISISTWSTSSTGSPSLPLQGLTSPDGITTSKHLDMTDSARSSKPSRTITTPSSTILKIG